MIIDTLIIGAGISGLTLARRLNRSCLILEKSRGVGGRIATRRITDLGLDHGAAYLPDSEEVRELYPGFSANGGELFVTGGMTQLPKFLACGLDIRKDQRAEKIWTGNGHWNIQTDQGESFQARRLILTCPLPQSLELLNKNQIPFAPILESIPYTKALMLLMTVRSLPEVQRLHPDLRSLLFMRERGLHPNGIVLRASETYSEENFERADEENLFALRERFLASLKAATDIDHIELRKWRYVLPKRALDCDFSEVAPNLFLIGDAFRIPDVRGAIASAEALARALKD